MSHEIESFSSAEPILFIPGPQVTSKDPEERKHARALRIKKRMTSLANRSEMFDDEEEETDIHVIEYQKKKSDHILEKVIKVAERDLNEIIVANKTHELNRRDGVNIKRKKLMDALESEANNCQRAFEKIVKKFHNLERCTDPVGVHKTLIVLKEKCDLLVKNRDQIMVTIKAGIQEEEKSFNVNQTKNLEDIEVLFQRMDQHIAGIKVSFDIQWRIVKNVIETSTDSYLRGRFAMWEELYNRLSTGIERLSEDRFRFIHKMDSGVHHVAVKFEEDFRTEKSILMNAINASRLDFRNLKAEVMRHHEKFEYNFQIIALRCEESTILGAEQKRIITKVQDIIIDLRSRIKCYKSKVKLKIKKCLRNIKYLHRQIIDIENKADYFAKSNEKIFNELWNLNKNNCTKIMNRILKIDKILHEQQLSAKWEKPEDMPLEVLNLPSYKYAAGFIKSTTVQKLSDYKPDKMTVLLQSQDSYKKVLKHILLQTSDKTGFLTETRIKSLLHNYGESEQTLVKLENVFESLMIEKEEDINLLMNFFLPYSYCKTCTASGARDPSINLTSEVSALSSVLKSSIDSGFFCDNQHVGDALMCATHNKEFIEEAVIEVVTSEVNLANFYVESEDLIDLAEEEMMDTQQKKSVAKRNPIIMWKEKMMCQYSHSLVICTVYVTKALREFVESFSNQGHVTIPTMNDRISKRRYTISRLINPKDITDYWGQYLKVYSEKSPRLNLWNGLASGLIRYLNILKDRKQLAEEVVNLRKQNNRLKKMLDSYKHHHRFLPPICEIQCVCKSKQPIMKIPRKTR